MKSHSGLTAYDMALARDHPDVAGILKIGDTDPS